jgi:glycosyltransferase involved in cell wall biosynthesis
MQTDSDRYSPHILCIIPLFAPAALAEAFCGTKMVQALMNRGASVTVLSSGNLWSGVPADSSGIWESVQKVIVDVPVSARRNPLHAILTAPRFQTPFNGRWLTSVIRTAKRLDRERKFDLVYTRSLPMVSHIAGFWCARELKLPWIANINDPWRFHFFLEEARAIGYSVPAKTDAAYPKLSAFQRHEQLFWLKRTLRTADLVTYPCKGLHDFHTKLSGIDHAAEIIPHVGYSPKGGISKSDSDFRLVHAGSLGSSEITGRSTNALLLGLRAFLATSPEATARTKLVLVGPEDRETQSLVMKLGLERNVENVGRVNYEQSVDYIGSASICILIEASMEESIFFPSKLADYLASRKPVLALSPNRGLAAELARRGELVHVGQNDPEAVRNAICRFYSELKQDTLSSCGPSDELVSQLEGNAVADKFLTECRALTTRSNTEYREARLKRVREQRSVLG